MTPASHGNGRLRLLNGVRVADLSSSLAGAYCTKLLVGFGADVIKFEGTHGDPLRSLGSVPGDVRSDGVLFRYLNESKRSVTLSPDDATARSLIDSADIVVETGGLEIDQIAEIRAGSPALTVVSITPFGKAGPWAERPSSEFTLQASSGSIGSRGTIDSEPLYAGGRIGEYLGGTYAAAVALALLHRSRRDGRGDHVDLSVLECLAIATHGYAALKASLGAVGFPASKRQAEVPSVTPTADGFINFTTNSRQQFDDLLVMIDRSDLLGDEELATRDGRQRRREEFTKALTDWTTRHPTSDIVELAGAFRIPAVPVNDADGVLGLQHVIERAIFDSSPDGSYRRPRPPFRFEAAPTDAYKPAPDLGADNGQPAWLDQRPPPRSGRSSGHDELPFAGLRVLDVTSWWAGPACTQFLGALGADVVRLESIQRPDGQRLTSTAWLPPTDHWWETSYLFQAVNTNKRSLTLDLGTPPGAKIARDLVRWADVIVENYSPRVMDGFGLTWESIHEINERCVYVRMPAFGLDGPWRDRTGFAQTMEAVSGMAWLTGHADGPPVLPRGPCDPLAGLHAASAVTAALMERECTGRGTLVEVPMFEVVLNVSAELVLERTAHGTNPMRDGNRGPDAAPQGVYRAAGDDRWVAVAVGDDAQWAALSNLVGGKLTDPRFNGAASRHRLHDEIDTVLAEWITDVDATETVAALLSCGVPAAVVADPLEVVASPQLRARGFVESFRHPMLGCHEVISMPFRLASRQGPWIRTASPMLGQHNAEILCGILGRSPDDLAALQSAAVIGTAPIS